MKIGIIGAGHIGATAARLFAGAGHQVAVSNSRGPASLEALVTEINRDVRRDLVHAASVNDAAAFGDIVLLAIPWRSPEGLPSADRLRGKVVIDAMNPYTATGGIMPLGDSTSSEEVAKRLPGARLVKAFNTIYYKHLAEEGDVSSPRASRRAIPVAGDDADAKQRVEKLIDEIGFAAVDTGSLREGGRRQEPNTSLYNRDLTADEAERVLRRTAEAR